MTTVARSRGQELKVPPTITQTILERHQDGFAYEMLALEIELEHQLEDRTYKMECLSKLLQLYMVTLAYMKIAVECL